MGPCTRSKRKSVGIDPPQKRMKTESDEEFQEMRPKNKPRQKSIVLEKPSCKAKPNTVKNVSVEKDIESSSSSSDSEWEDVSDLEDENRNRMPPINKEGVEITLDVQDAIGSKRRKKEFDIEDEFRLRLNRYKKLVQMDMHKTHLLCLVARGIFLSKLLANDEIRAVTLSMVPAKFLEKPKKNKRFLTDILTWFSNSFHVTDKSPELEKDILLSDCITSQIRNKEPQNKEYFVMILAVIFLIVGYECRMVFSLQPVSLKPRDLKPKNPQTDKLPNKKQRDKTSAKRQEHVNSNKRKSSRKLVSTDSDSDFEEPRKSKSPSAEKKPDLEQAGEDIWLEVCFDKCEEWVPLNPFTQSLNNTLEIEERASKPFHYVLSFDVDGYVKDVTFRYTSQWFSVVRKLKVIEDWWKDTLNMPRLRGQQSQRDNMEDKWLQQKIEEAPIPKTVSQIKNHPLYILQRHLLKFQGIYPSESVAVAYIRGEAVYSRDCVHTLHSRETWLKDAKMVREGETPYKLVKARPKWNKTLGAMQTDIPLELFGEWQTENYIPAPVKDGKIPRNKFGNVELFKPCMLPPGAVHLQDLPGLHKVARQLDVDCAAAMVGWDFHGVGSHPLFDGWVVCEEHKDMLLDAWQQDQEIKLQRQREKREKEIYGNWRKLIRGLLIRERLQAQHGET